MATPSSDEEKQVEALFEGFSDAVRSVGERLRPESVTIWELAVQLLLELSPDSNGALEWLLVDQTSGEPHTLVHWLERVVALFDREALIRLSSRKIDERLMLLGLARLDPELDRRLRQKGVRLLLEEDLGYQLADVFWPWALPLRPTEWIERQPIRGHSGPVRVCAFSPDGQLLASAGEDGMVWLWDVASGRGHDMFHGHRGSVGACAFSPDGRLLACAGEEGMVWLWDVASGQEHAVLYGHEGAAWRCVFGPDGQLLASTGMDRTVRLWDVASGREHSVLYGHSGPVRVCAFSPDGQLLASAGEDGMVWLWDVASGRGHAVLYGHRGPVGMCVFSPDGRLLASTGMDGTVRLWDVASDQEQSVLYGHRGPVGMCVFSPDGRLLASTGMDGTVRLWDVASDQEQSVLHGHSGPVRVCAFSPDGRLLASTGMDGAVRLWDVASGREHSVLYAHRGSAGMCVFSPDGQLLASTGEDGTVRLWEEAEVAAALSAVAPDVADGVDLLSVGEDVNAIANLVAAGETMPPLSIGLFGDWGSGKSFFIGQVQRRVRQLALRSQRAERSAYCAHVRNVSFNAWHYTDANLWASLVAHIFDELAKPEPDSGVASDATALAQVARLEEKLAESSALTERLRRARDHRRQVEARQNLLRWTWKLTGANDECSLGEVQDDVRSTRGAMKLLVPNAAARLALVVLALLAAVVVFGVVALVGGEQVMRVSTAVVAAVAAPLAALGVVRKHVVGLLEQAGKTLRAIDVRDTDIDIELELASAAERELQRELSDLSAGRRLARLASERSGDYREHLGLISRIHDDFVRMSKLLHDERYVRRTGSGAAGARGGEDSDLPRIDRIVLYIDDLDRCPPRRVMEVLEAVHLILAVPLFVVVVAVDPRWLLQSLKLHYAEMLAHDKQQNELSDSEASRWEASPIHYLEKIIQVPFALRPMSENSVRSLVHGLLPVEKPVEEPGNEQRMTDPTKAREPAADQTVQASDTSESPGQPEEQSVPLADLVPPASAPSLNPRTLALTEAERDFTVTVSAGLCLRTPRMVKKFTNLYRLLRVGLDDRSGELDRFLNEDTGDAPEYQAVLILLAAIIAFPEDASSLLIGLLEPSTRNKAWVGYVQHSEPKRCAENLRRFLETVTPMQEHEQQWTCEPFRRWALEVSRYSFATGQEVFARFNGVPTPDLDRVPQSSL